MNLWIIFNEPIICLQETLSQVSGNGYFAHPSSGSSKLITVTPDSSLNHPTIVN